MKKLYSKIFAYLGVAVAAQFLWSCSAEEPFHSENDGSALVKLGYSVNTGTSLTRAAINDPDLDKSAILYISDSNGLLHKWIGKENIPQEGVYLRYGNYLAEAWAGDSVPASFENKFYKGATSFEVSANHITTQVSVVCKLANVVTSVDYSSLNQNILNDLKLEIKSANAQLDFEGETLSEKGYFMLPYDKENNIYLSTLTYKLTGKDIDGSSFEKSGVIENVLAAHEYRINIYQEEVGETGGAVIKIQIVESEIIEDTVDVHSRPEFSWENNQPVIGGQIFSDGGNFQDGKRLYIGAYRDANRKGGFTSLILKTENDVMKTRLGGFAEIDLMQATESVLTSMLNQGLEISDGYYGPDYRVFTIHFTKEWLTSLPDCGAQEYVIDITATDNRGMSNSMKVGIANNKLAMATPFEIAKDFFKKNLLAVRAYSANVPVTLYDDVENLTIQYRKSSETDWISSNVEKVAGTNNTFRLSNLEAATNYVVRAVGGEISGETYEFISEEVNFTTEEVYTIPNAGMDQWLKSGKVWEPSADTSHSFWDTGNHGSTAISANDNLTTEWTQFYHSAPSCARLESKFVGIAGLVGKHGAGNIFVGEYAGTSGTNGKINFGKEYNATHPSKVRVWVNYRPKVADKGGNNKYIKKGELDQGQIYIALSDQIKKVDTSDESTLVTQDKASSLFLAYGEKTFVGNYGAENTLEMVEIDFNYFDNAKTTAPKYLIIVCCASKYGDFFSGGEGSAMYVDDFELVYE